MYAIYSPPRLHDSCNKSSIVQHTTQIKWVGRKIPQNIEKSSSINRHCVACFPFYLLAWENIQSSRHGKSLAQNLFGFYLTLQNDLCQLVDPTDYIKPNAILNHFKSLNITLQFQSSLPGHGPHLVNSKFSLKVILPP